MNDSTCSVKSSTDRIEIASEKLQDIINDYPLFTTVYASNENGRPYILLEDIDHEKYWRPYNGEPVEHVKTWHQWELACQKHFSNNRRSQAEMDELRDIILATQKCIGFFEMNEDEAKEFLNFIIIKTAETWRATDIEKNDGKLEGIDCEEVYMNLSIYYLRSFILTMIAVKDGKVAVDYDKLAKDLQNGTIM